MSLAPPTAANIADFSVSRLEHFDLFKGVPFKSYNVADPDPAACDLKVYQDHLVYQFITANVPKGSRLLEVGGGDSRVLKHFSSDYECYTSWPRAPSTSIGRRWSGARGATSVGRSR